VVVVALEKTILRTIKVLGLAVQERQVVRKRIVQAAVAAVEVVK
jgi:hypothetical protein